MTEKGAKPCCARADSSASEVDCLLEDVANELLDDPVDWRQAMAECKAWGLCYYDESLDTEVHRFPPGKWVCKCGTRDCTPDPEARRRWFGFKPKQKTSQGNE